MTDRDELRRVAEAATPGPWASGGVWWEHYDDPEGRKCHTPWPTVTHGTSGADLTAKAFAEEDATYIATFDPPTVLALLDDLEAAEAEAHNLAHEVDRVRERLWRLSGLTGHTPGESDNDATAELVVTEALRTRAMEAVTAVTPCSCSAQRARADATPAALAQLVEGVRGLMGDQLDETCACGGCASCTFAEVWAPRLTALLAEVEGRRMSEQRPTLYALLLAGVIEWAGEDADMEDCRELTRHLTPIVRTHIESARADLEARILAGPSCGSRDRDHDGCYVHDALRAVRSPLAQPTSPANTGGDQ